MLWGSPADDPENANRLSGLRSYLARVDTALGDAAGNPLLLTMALELVQQGVAFTDRAGLYRLFIEQLAARSGATSIAEASAALGIVYAALLDRGRRYADPIEWARLLRDAVAVLASAGVPVDVNSIETAVRRCGLITPLGWTQTRVPIHDSFADYLAGAAHANRLAAFPDRLQPSDEQRVMFAAEIGGVDAAMTAQVARDLPLLTVYLAAFAPWPSRGRADRGGATPALSGRRPRIRCRHVADQRRQGRSIPACRRHVGLGR